MAVTARDSDVDIDTSSDRISAAEDAGDTYTNNLETIRDTLDKQDNSGTTLGTMVSSQLALTEAEARYEVQKGIPEKESKQNKEASKGIKQA